MSKRIPSAFGFLFLTILVVGCGSASQTKNATDAQTQSQPSPSIAKQGTSAAPCPTPSAEASRKLIITAPCDGSTVAQRHFVEGVVADAKTQVWVVIHPMELGDYWVQPNVTVRDGGKWKVLCYFGDPGLQHSGKRYKFMAITSPKGTLREGQLIPNWPEAQSKSQVVEVVRE